jgi:stearoyl-CoA desaturase (delta-9 desaturase)
MGEGWHNNHHYYQISTRQGFRWYEIDPTYYALKVLSWIGLVWNLHTPPEEVLLGERRLSRRAVDKVAHRLAGTFHVDSLVEQAREAWAHKPHLDLPELHLPEIHLPHLPSLDELKRRAGEMALRTPSLDDVAKRAREILAEAVALRLAQAAAPA